MFGTYKEAIEILKAMRVKATSDHDRAVLTLAIVEIQDAWYTEEKAFARAHLLTVCDEIDEKEIN